MRIRIASIVWYANVFMLSLAIGLNSHSVYVWLNTPPEPEYCNA